MLGGIEAIGETGGGITESGEDGDGVETDKNEGTGTINFLLVETPLKSSPTSMVIAVLSVRFFASSISVIIVNFCFFIKVFMEITWCLLLLLYD